MEFIEFLDREEIEIIRMVEQAGYLTRENTQLCLLDKNYVGFLIKNQKKIIICTNNAINKESYTYLRKLNTDVQDRIALRIKKAIRHEAVHVAQECNGGKVLNINQKLSMNPAKIKALKGSIKISGAEDKERQAYILENKPKLVEKELKKYCL